GLRPFAVIANAGTTNTGAIDPLREIAAFCLTHDLWMHVDGAYGAAVVICERGRKLLDGIELADSRSFDPHKWLLQTIECGWGSSVSGGAPRLTASITNCKMRCCATASDSQRRRC